MEPPVDPSTSEKIQKQMTAEMEAKQNTILLLKKVNLNLKTNLEKSKSEVNELKVEQNKCLDILSTLREELMNKTEDKHVFDLLNTAINDLTTKNDLNKESQCDGTWIEGVDSTLAVMPDLENDASFLTNNSSTNENDGTKNDQNHSLINDASKNGENVIEISYFNPSNHKDKFYLIQPFFRQKSAAQKNVNCFDMYKTLKNLVKSVFYKNDIPLYENANNLEFKVTSTNGPPIDIILEQFDMPEKRIEPNVGMWTLAHALLIDYSKRTEIPQHETIELNYSNNFNVLDVTSQPQPTNYVFDNLVPSYTEPVVYVFDQAANATVENADSNNINKRKNQNSLTDILNELPAKKIQSNICTEDITTSAMLDTSNLVVASIISHSDVVQPSLVEANKSIQRHSHSTRSNSCNVSSKETAKSKRNSQVNTEKPVQIRIIKRRSVIVAGNKT